MSSCWKKDTAEIMVREILGYIDDPFMKVLPVLKSDKHPNKFEELISYMKIRVPGLQARSALSEPRVNKIRARYIFQYLLKLCAQDKIILSEIAKKLGTDSSILNKYIKLERLDGYSLMFNPSIASVFKVAMSLTLDVFISLAKHLINSDRFKRQMQERKELKVIYLLWMCNLLDFSGVDVNDVYLVVTKVYSPVSKLSLCVEPDTNDQEISKISIDANSDSEYEDVGLEIIGISEVNNSQEDLGVGTGIGSVFLHTLLGLGYVVSSTVGGLAGLGMSSSGNSFSFLGNGDSGNVDDINDDINNDINNDSLVPDKKII